MAFTFLMFVILLSIIVVFHEAGHFLVGKAFKIGVEAFAVGFGRPIFKFKKGETEYRLNWIPFGGYVKFVGEMDDDDVPDELKDKAFTLRPAYQKAAVVVAGPFMNVVLTFLIFAIMFLVGFPTPTATIGRVSADSAAAEAGIRVGDRIVEIDGVPIWKYEDLSEMIGERPEKETRIVVLRDGERVPLTVKPRLGDKKNVFGMIEQKGVLGISDTGVRPILGIPYPDSLATAAGFKSGMVVLAVDGEEVFFEQELRSRLAQGNAKNLTVVENWKGAEEDWVKQVLPLPEAKPVEESMLAANPLAPYDMEFADLYIHKILDKSAAKEAGFQEMDRILSVDGVPIETFRQFQEIVSSSEGKELKIDVRREGQVASIDVTPQVVREKDLMGKTNEYVRIGIVPLIVGGTITEEERHLNPLMIVKRAYDLSLKWTVITAKAFGYIITGQVPFKAVGGPFTIAVMAGESARLGIFPFFLLMAIISINLAVVNMVPIPIFDGGHLFFFTLEMVRRKPTSQRVRDISMQIGMAMLAMMVVFILYADFSRYSLSIAERLTDLYEKVVNF